MADWDDGLPMTETDRTHLTACADLVGRTGARQFQIGHLDDDPASSTWYAHAMYRGARIGVEAQSGPGAAARALAGKLLTGAKCRCGRLVALSDAGAVAYGGGMADGSTFTVAEARAAGQCRWRLVGERWEPSCPVPAGRKQVGR